MQNHGYLEMTSPPWPQNKPSCQGASRKIWHKEQGNPFLDVIIVPSPKADTFNKYWSTGYSNPSKSQYNYQGSRSKNGFFSFPSPEGTSARLSECMVSWRTLTSDPQIPSIVSGYKIVFPQNSLSKVATFYPSIGSLRRHS